MGEVSIPRQETMNSGKRMFTQAIGQKPDRVPFVISAMGFSARTVGYPIASTYNDPQKSFWAQLWTNEMYGTDGSPLYLMPASPEFGGEIKFPTNEWEQSPTLISYPVQSEDDIDKLTIPDIKTAGLYPLAMEFSNLCKEYHMPIQILAGSPFTKAGTLCGVNNLCRWMMKKPAMAHKLLRFTTDLCLQVVQLWVDTFGAKRVTPYTAAPTESNRIISVKQFEEFAFPYVKELHEKALAMGVRRFVCHICGDQNANLPYWSQIPMGFAGMVSFGHEVDLTTAIKYFGDKCIIAGNIEPQVIQNGTPQQVYELAKQCIEKAKFAPKGFILMPGCELPPMAPPYNVYMLKKAVMDFGWYD